MSYHSDIPPRTKNAIDRYVDKGLPPGGFLKAVLTNRLVQSFALADRGNKENMEAIVKYLYNDVPAVAWGSEEKVSTWIKNKQEETNE